MVDNSLAFETLSKFRSYGYGLIDPDGKIIPITLFNHFEELKKDERLAQEIEDFNDMIADAAIDHVRDLGEGEHPEWHLYEMWADREKERFRTEILEKAYALGWGRLGKFYYYDGRYEFVELEANEQHAPRLKKIAEELAAMLNYELKVTIR